MVNQGHRHEHRQMVVQEPRYRRDRLRNCSGSAAGCANWEPRSGERYRRGVRVLRRCRAGTGNRIISDPDQGCSVAGTSCRTSMPLGQDDASEASAGKRPDTARDDDRYQSACGAFGNDQARQGGMTGGVDCPTAAIQLSPVRVCPAAAQGNAGLGLVDHEVYGRRRKGRTLRTTTRGATARCTGPWRRPAMCCIWGCGKAIGAHQLRDQGSAAGNDQIG